MYALDIKPKAIKSLARLPKKYQAKIVDAFEILKENPLAGKELDGEFAGIRSLRVWPYRILYVIDDKIITVTVLKIGHRQNVYKK